MMPWDITQFETPRLGMVQPKARPDPLSDLPSLMMGVLNHNSSIDQQEKDRAQRAALQASEQNVQMRGQDINEQARKDTNERMDREKAQATILALTSAYSGADPAQKEVILQQLQQLGGLRMTEHASNYQPPEQPEVPAEQPSAAPQPGQDDVWKRVSQVETGGNPAAVNKTTGAAGAFQVMPDQLKQMGMTPQQVAGMSYDEQKQKVLPGYLGLHGLPGPDQIDPNDAYLTIAAPAAVGKPDESVVYPKGSKEAKGNPLWDVNKDGQVTAGEIRQLVPGKGGATSPDQPRDIGDLDQWALNQGIGAQVAKEGAAPQTPGGPMPWEELGLPGPQKGPGGEQVVPGGGRFVFTDPKTGKVAFDFDSKAINAQQQKAVEEGIAPLLAGAAPEQKQIAKQVTELGKSLVGKGFTPKEAQEKAIEEWNKMTGQQVQANRGQSQGAFQQLKALQMDADRTLARTSSQYGLPKLNEGELDVRNGLQGLQEDLKSPPGHNGLRQMTAFARMVKSLEGGRISDPDWNRYVNSTGWLNNFLNLGNRVINGEQNPEIIDQLKTILSNQGDIIKARKKEAGETAYANVMAGSPYPNIGEEEKRTAAGRIRSQILGGQQDEKKTPDTTGGTSLDDLDKLIP